MQLYTSPTSPYARLVRVVLLEKQLNERVDYHFLDPWETPAELLAVNPACRVPTLVTHQQDALTEAGVIVLYLERRYPEPRLMARDNVESVHSRLGAALGCLDAGIGLLVEQRHGDATTDLANRRREQLQRTTQALVEQIDSERDGDPDLGDLASAVALDWLDFRYPETVVWRDWRPSASDWLARMTARPAFAETAPPPV